MSDNSRNLIWLYYDERLGAPMILAIALADASNDFGAGISEKNEDLAHKTRQTVRAIRMQLRRLESSRFLKRVEAGGGRGISGRYELNLAMLVTQKDDAAPQEKGERGSGFEGEKPGTAFPLSDADTRNGVPGFEDNTIRSTKELRRMCVEAHGDGVATFRVSMDAEDRKLAEWMFGKLQALNPKLRAPSWPAWVKDVRLMRERDKRTHREIATLFAFAHGDEFWQSNIESPRALRRQWNKLALKMGRAGGNGAGQAEAVDTRCAGVAGGERCAGLNTTSDSVDGRGPFYCWPCREAMQRESASKDAQSAGGSG